MAEQVRGQGSEDLAALHDRLVAGAALDDEDRRTLALARDLATETGTATLPDGRRLGYADVGDPAGRPLVVLHGFPNARPFGALFDAAGRDHGRRVLVPERPGFGVSDPDPGRSLTDWPADLEGFAEALDLGSFPLLGVSGGGPYALASAALSDRVERVGVAVGVGPLAAVGVRARLPYLLARYVPPLVRRRLRTEATRAREDPEAHIESRADDAAPVDADRWRGVVGRVLLLNHVEASRHHGTGPLADELAIYARPWGFDLGNVDVPTHLWYGGADRIVPVEMGRHLADRLPHAEASFDPDLGHLSTVLENEDAILAALTGD